METSGPASKQNRSMTPSNLRLCRSLLFLPASNARAIEKARDLPVDLVVLDLEAAVKAEDKESARRMAAKAAAKGFGDKPATLRIKPDGSHFRGHDRKNTGAGTSGG